MLEPSLCLIEINGVLMPRPWYPDRANATFREIWTSFYSYGSKSSAAPAATASEREQRLSTRLGALPHASGVDEAVGRSALKALVETSSQRRVIPDPRIGH